MGSNIVNVNTVTATNSVTLTNKTLDKAVLLGTPAATGAEGRDATQKAAAYFDNGQLGNWAKVIPAACGVGTQAFTNSVATDQDFTAIYTLPANVLFTNKVYRVSLLIEVISAISVVTMTFYLKLGANKVVSMAGNFIDSLTRSHVLEFLIVGRAAPSGASNVSTAIVSGMNFANNVIVPNSVDQPVASDTSNAGGLAITPGVTFSATTGTPADSIELQAWTLEELN